MKTKTYIIIFVTAFIVLSIVYDNVYTNRIIAGKYYYDYPQTLEGPHQGDYLILKENGEFESDTWGKGTYKINGSKIELSYTYELGEAGAERIIYRPYFWGKPRISIDRDLVYFFEKIE